MSYMLDIKDQLGPQPEKHLSSFVLKGLQIKQSKGGTQQSSPRLVRQCSSTVELSEIFNISSNFAHNILKGKGDVRSRPNVLEIIDVIGQSNLGIGNEILSSFILEQAAQVTGTKLNELTRASLCHSCCFLLSWKLCYHCPL